MAMYVCNLDIETYLTYLKILKRKKKQFVLLKNKIESTGLNFEWDVRKCRHT